jgi:hypothetical protein
MNSGLEILHLDAGVVQSLLFLKFAIAGYMKIYLARIRQHHFWERPLPLAGLFGITEITRIGATWLLSTDYS